MSCIIEAKYTIARKYFKEKYETLPIETKMELGVNNDISKIDTLSYAIAMLEKQIHKFEQEQSTLKAEVVRRWEHCKRYEKNVKKITNGEQV